MKCKKDGQRPRYYYPDWCGTHKKFWDDCKLVATARAEAIKEVLGSEEIRGLIKIMKFYEQRSNAVQLALAAFNEKWGKA